MHGQPTYYTHHVNSNNAPPYWTIGSPGHHPAQVMPPPQPGHGVVDQSMLHRTPMGGHPGPGMQQPMANPNLHTLPPYKVVPAAAAGPTSHYNQPASPAISSSSGSAAAAGAHDDNSKLAPPIAQQLTPHGPQKQIVPHQMKQPELTLNPLNQPVIHQPIHSVSS